MKTKQRDVRDFVISEYSKADRDYIMDDISTKNRIIRIRRLKRLLCTERTMLIIKPDCEAYYYFLEEFRNKLAFDHENIIVPNSEKNSTRRLD